MRHPVKGNCQGINSRICPVTEIVKQESQGIAGGMEIVNGGIIGLRDWFLENVIP